MTARIHKHMMLGRKRKRMMLMWIAHAMDATAVQDACQINPRADGLEEWRDAGLK
jgi:hypothetical protein